MSQVLVISALLKREVSTRFGEYRLGFFWMLIEPLIGVLVMGLLIGPFAERSVPEIPYAFFLLNGFLMLQLFTSTMNMGLNPITAEQGLLVYPTVKPLDPILSRFLLSFFMTMLSYILFCVIGMWLGMTFSLYSLHIVLAAFIITWFCGCGFGLILGVMAVHFKEIEKVTKVIQRPLVFVSAVLFPTNALPDATKEILLYNPLVHTIELSRHALFPFYPVEGTNLLYPGGFAIVIFAIGITYFHNNRHLLSEP